MDNNLYVKAEEIEKLDESDGAINNCKKIKFEYNPFSRKIFIYNFDNTINKFYRKSNLVYKNISFMDLETKFIKNLCDKLNTSNVDISFVGTDYSFEHLSELIRLYNNEHFANSTIEFIQKVDTKNKMEEARAVYELMKLFKNNELQEIFPKESILDIEECLNEKNQLVVCATMSSGKSSLINSMLHYKLMPSKNEACTAKIVRLEADNKLTDFENLAGEKISDEYMKNENERTNEDTTIYIKGPIKSFNDVENFELIDTPGPNNSLNNDHKVITYDFIKSDIKPMTLVLLDATKLLTDDEADFISTIAQESKNKGKINKERFIFVVNKCDSLRGEDSLENIKNNITEKLKEYDINNPKIHFVSAKNALLARMDSSRIELNIDDEEDLDIAIRRARRNASEYYKLSDMSVRVRKIISDTIERAIEKNDFNTLVVATSGVLGLELSIKEFMSNYKEARIISKVLRICNRCLENKTHLEDLQNKILNNKDKSENLKIAINKSIKKIGDPDKINQFYDEMVKIKFGDSLSPIEKTINKEFDEFRIAIKKLPTKKVNGKTLVNTKQAIQYVTKLQKKYAHLRANLLSEFTASVSRDIENTLEDFMNRYTKYLSTVFQDIKISSEVDISKYLENVGENYLEHVTNSKIKETVIETHIVRNPMKTGFRRIFFWRDNYIEEHSVKSVEGIEISVITGVLTDAREDIYKLYSTIKEEKNKALNKCMRTFKKQVEEATDIVRKEMEKMEKMLKQHESYSENIKQYIEELDTKKKLVSMVERKVKMLESLN